MGENKGLIIKIVLAVFAIGALLGYLYFKPGGVKTPSGPTQQVQGQQNSEEPPPPGTDKNYDNFSFPPESQPPAAK